MMQYKSALSYVAMPSATHDTPVGSFEGYASVFNVVDSDGDIVAPGAFASAVRAFLSGEFRPHLLWQHQTDQVLGRITHMAEDATGLLIKAELLLSLIKAQEAYALLREGLIQGLSIGFVPVLTTRHAPAASPTPHGRTLVHVKLVEVSLVTLPANPKATVTQVKHQGMPMAG